MRHRMVLALLSFAVALTGCCCPLARRRPSPADGWIAFSSSSQICMMRADGSGRTCLTDGPGLNVEPTWSPDGGKIAFVGQRDDSSWSIYVVDVKGGPPVRLTHGEGDHDPAWSPDGTRIAFSSRRDGNDEIYAMRADGTDQTRLTDDTGYDWEPSWSPDGTRIAFASTRDGRSQIYVMQAHGSDPVRLTNVADEAGSPAWSPDGRMIAFCTGNDEIHVIRTDGGGLKRLTDHRAGNASHPTWSPDGAWIASYSESFVRGIYAMRPDGSQRVCLVGGLDAGRDPTWGSGKR